MVELLDGDPSLNPALNPASVGHVNIDDWLKTVTTRRYRQRGRLPAHNTLQVVRHDVNHLQRSVNFRHSRLAWWEHDVWAPVHDTRIPLQERNSGRTRLSFADMKHPWLKEGLKFYFRVLLETGRGAWGSLLNGRVHMCRYFDDYLTTVEAATGHDYGPRLVDNPADEVHGFALNYLSYLRTRTSVTGSYKGQRFSDATLHTSVTQLSAFYRFAFDNRRELATMTGDRRWLELTESHLRMVRSHEIPVRRSGNFPPPRPGRGVIAAEDLSAMLEHLDVLGLPTSEHKTIVTAGTTRRVAGLGDPSAMRAWLLQAMTGRRCNEILKCAFNPLEQVDALHRTPATPATPNANDDGRAIPDREDDEGGQDPKDGDEEYIARFYYRQTKVDGAPNSILVGRDVVTVIEDQQAWVRELLGLRPGESDPPFLFPRLRRNGRGLHPRPDSGYHKPLQVLSETLDLKDRHGHRLEYSKSHRLRHTKATTLLNLGAPFHVVMRYLGHRTPDMTLHYAVTLEETAEKAFLHTQAIGRDGRDLDMNVGEVVQLAGLSTRTDRVLSNGLGA